MLGQVKLGAKVHTADGGNAGKLKYFVADPQTKEVTHIIVDRGAFNAREAVVSVGQVGQIDADGHVLTLNMSVDELNKAPQYADRDYTSQPSYAADVPNASEGLVFPTQTSGVAVASTLEVPPPLKDGQVQSTDYTTEIHMNVPEDSLIIKAGDKVVAKDGDVGRVKDVTFTDGTNRLESFVIEKGFLFTKEIVVPATLVETTLENMVYLTATVEEVQNLG
jgi:uncharacterized protein YrrD